MTLLVQLESFDRFEISQMVQSHTGRKLDPDVSFYVWLPYVLPTQEDTEGTFYTLRMLKKFLFVSAHLYLARSLEMAVVALSRDLTRCGHLYRDDVHIDTFVRLNPVFARAENKKQHLAQKKKDTSSSFVRGRGRKGNLRYAEIPA